MIVSWFLLIVQIEVQIVTAVTGFKSVFELLQILRSATHDDKVGRFVLAGRRWDWDNRRCRLRCVEMAVKNGVQAAPLFR